MCQIWMSKQPGWNVRVVFQEKFSEENRENLILLQTELQDIRQEKMKGHFVRSIANWIDNGEKATIFL